MTRPLAFVYHEAYDGRGFSRLRDSWRRYSLARALLGELGFFAEALRWYRQEAAGEADLLTVHDAAYVRRVRDLDAAGSGLLDYGDTPAYPGVLRRALLAVGGTLLGARLVASGEVAHAFNPGGGLHHAREATAGGFCVFNDVAIAVRALQREFAIERIAIVDFDGHHGDGTEALFYREPVLTVSLHRYDGRFYPRTGTATERGTGQGLGYNLNLPLPRGTGDEDYLHVVEEAVLPRLRAYRPQMIIVQVGADGHHADPLVRLALTAGAYARLGLAMHQAAHDLCEGRLLMVAGGGYKPEAVAWCWASFLAAITGAPNEEAAGRLMDAQREAPSTLNAEAPAQVRAMLAEARARGALGEPA